MAFAHGAFQVAVRRRDHTNGHLNISHAADTPDELVFQHAQELCLQQRRKFANFVQKQRALVGHFEQTLLHGLGIGERPALVAKQFRLHQRLGNRGTIDGHKRFVFPRALIMNGLRHQVFACPAFPLNQNRTGFAGGHFVHELHQFSHFSRHANDIVIAGAPAHFSAQGLHFVAERSRFQRVLQRDAEFLVIDRLADKVVRAQPQRGFHIFQLRIGRHHDDCARVAALLQLFQDLNAALAGQVHVKQYGVRRLVLQRAQRFFSIGSLNALVAVFDALLRKRPAHEFFVVYD